MTNEEIKNQLDKLKEERDNLLDQAEVKEYKIWELIALITANN